MSHAFFNNILSRKDSHHCLSGKRNNAKNDWQWKIVLLGNWILLLEVFVCPNMNKCSKNVKWVEHKLMNVNIVPVSFVRRTSSYFLVQDPG